MIILDLSTPFRTKRYHLKENSSMISLHLFSILSMLVMCQGFQHKPCLNLHSSNTMSKVLPIPTTAFEVICPFMLSELRQEEIEKEKDSPNDSFTGLTPNLTWLKELSFKRPPVRVDDESLLLYDVFLIVNLVLSISFWAVHRMDFSFVIPALNEGCLLSILWITSGLYHGAFLNSAIDGNYESTDERGGPKAAGLLAFHTYTTTVTLRLLFAFAIAVMQHQPVGAVPSDQYIPLEIGVGFMQMIAWRVMHSLYTPRL